MSRRPLTSRMEHAACRAALSNGSRSFAAAARLLPGRVREPATVLYAFCRAADDAVDLGQSAAALAELRTRLAACYGEAGPAAPVDRAFAELVAQHDLPRALPEALLDGFGWDAAGRRYRTLEALLEYAMCVAGSVGAMMAVLMGVRDPAVLQAACELGCAMQLTNIARDVGEDARAGRLYLPLDWLAEAGIDPAAFLAAPAFSPALGGVVARLLDEAARRYASAAAGIRRLPAACRPAIRAAALLYAGIGGEIRRQGCDTVSARAVLRRRRKLMLLPLMVMPHRARMLADFPASHRLVDVIGVARPRRIPLLQRIDNRIAWTAELFARLEHASKARGFAP